MRLSVVAFGDVPLCAPVPGSLLTRDVDEIVDEIFDCELVTLHGNDTPDDCTEIFASIHQLRGECCLFWNDFEFDVREMLETVIQDDLNGYLRAVNDEGEFTETALLDAVLVINFMNGIGTGLDEIVQYGLD